MCLWFARRCYRMAPMADPFHVDPALAEGLARVGVANARDLLVLGDAPDAHRVARFVSLDVPGTTGRFYLKRYTYRGWRTARGLIGRGTLWGTPPEINEFHALRWLRAHGVPAVRPVAAAARRTGGRLAAHALLTEAVPGVVDLDRRLHTPGDALRASRTARRDVAAAIGETLARMHALGFVHRDCHARNILVSMETETPRIWLCDCRRGGVGGRRRGPAYDLACLDRDLRGVMTRGERRRALAAYLGPRGDAKETVRRIARIREGLTSPRRVPAPA